MLGLPNEEASGILPSRRVVNWYNGSLDNDLDTQNEFNLQKIRDLVVIGNGNIFCDMARTLLKEPAVFDETDMPISVIDLLRKSKLQNVQAIARRGITHSAFTTKEIREVSAIPGLELYMFKEEVQRSMTQASENEMRSNYARAVGRRTEFLLKDFRAIDSQEHYEELLENGKKKLILRYLLAPQEFIIEDGHVKAMKFTQ